MANPARANVNGRLSSYLPIRRNQSNDPDIELQLGLANVEVKEARLALLRAIRNDQAAEEDQNPAFPHYLDYLQCTLASMPRDISDIVLPEVHDNAARRLAQVRLATGIVKTIVSGDQTSLLEILQSVAASGLVHEDCTDSQKSQADALRMVFDVIGWVTMLFQPKATTSRSTSFRIEQVSTHIPESSQGLDKHGRPLVELLRAFGLFRPRDPEELSADASKSTTELLVSNLNAATLSDIGDIGIVWTNCISNHLDLESYKLKVFALPSFCEVYLHDEDETHRSFLHRVLDGFWEPYEQSQGIDSLAHEICLSYRLIFASDDASVQRFRKIERARAQAAVHNIHDSFLDKLCGHKRDVNLQKTYPTRSAYRAEDFPVFGRKLFTLQDHVLSQNPTRVKMLWKDRRDMLRWYTFWAVLIIGGVGVILALFQTILGAMQVALGFVSLNNSG